MTYPLLTGAVVSLINFGIHALMTGLIVVATRRMAAATDDRHVFARVTALLMITLPVLMLTHVFEIGIWGAAVRCVGVPLIGASAFEFAFENYVALGYGDVIANGGWRLIGPVVALNGLLLIGWSVAIIFEVMRMAEVHIGRRPRSG